MQGKGVGPFVIDHPPIGMGVQGGVETLLMMGRVLRGGYFCALWVTHKSVVVGSGEWWNFAIVVTFWVVSNEFSSEEFFGDFITGVICH